MEDLHEFFGMTIKNARMDCGLTQEALAERAGISCRYLIAIENEGRIPKLPAVYRLIHSITSRRTVFSIRNSHQKGPSGRSLPICWNPAPTGTSISFLVPSKPCCRNNEQRTISRTLWGSGSSPVLCSFPSSGASHLLTVKYSAVHALFFFNSPAR